MSKYTLVPELELFRLIALIDFGNIKAGDKGGLVAGPHSLSQQGDCWVSGDARVYDRAQVYGRAHVFGEAEVYGRAQVFGEAEVYDEARVGGDALVSGASVVFHEQRVEIQEDIV